MMAESKEAQLLRLANEAYKQMDPIYKAAVGRAKLYNQNHIVCPQAQQVILNLISNMKPGLRDIRLAQGSGEMTSEEAVEHIRALMEQTLQVAFLAGHELASSDLPFIAVAGLCDCDDAPNQHQN
jgi:hypothetical protein